MKGWHHHHDHHPHRHRKDERETLPAGPEAEAQAEARRRHYRRWMRRAPRVRRLQARLFFWFLAAIFAAFLAAMLSSWLLRGAETSSPPAVATRAIAGRLAREWDDPQACDAYVARVRELIGLDVRLRRDIDALPHRMSLHGGRSRSGPTAKGSSRWCATASWSARSSSTRGSTPRPTGTASSQSAPRSSSSRWRRAAWRGGSPGRSKT